MDEKYELYKKSKEYKLHILMNVFLVLLFIIIVYCAYYFYQTYNGSKKTPNENINYFYEINNNEVLLFSSDGLEETYKCNSECSIFSGNRTEGYFYKGKILLKDGDVIYLYDLLNNKKLGGDYHDVDFILNDEGTDITSIELLKVSDSFNRQGIMNLNGTLLVDVIYEALGNVNEQNQLINYSYSRNYITAKSGSIWGLVSLNSGKGHIDFQYEDIIVSKYNKLAVKEANLWYLVDDSNKKIIAKGYDSMIILENYLIVSENKKAFILDYLGNVISNKIDLTLDIDYWKYNNQENGLYIEQLDDKNYIIINQINNGKSKSEKYIYDEETKQLVKA